MNKLQKGFTIIEVMIVVAIIAILATVAYPAYQDYANRSKISEVLAFASSAKTAVSECLLSTGSVSSCETNALVGLDTVPSNISSTYVQSVEIGTDAEITLVIHGTDESVLDASSIIFKPIFATGGSSVNWNCTTSTSDIYQYVPNDCRNI